MNRLCEIRDRQKVRQNSERSSPGAPLRNHKVAEVNFAWEFKPILASRHCTRINRLCEIRDRQKVRQNSERSSPGMPLWNHEAAEVSFAWEFKPILHLIVKSGTAESEAN